MFETFGTKMFKDFEGIEKFDYFNIKLQKSSEIRDIKANLNLIEQRYHAIDSLISDKDHETIMSIDIALLQSIIYEIKCLRVFCGFILKTMNESGIRHLYPQVFGKALYFCLNAKRTWSGLGFDVSTEWSFVEKRRLNKRGKIFLSKAKELSIFSNPFA